MADDLALALALADAADALLRHARLSGGFEPQLHQDLIDALSASSSV